MISIVYMSDIYDTGKYATARCIPKHVYTTYTLNYTIHTVYTIHTIYTVHTIYTIHTIYATHTIHTCIYYTVLHTQYILTLSEGILGVAIIRLCCITVSIIPYALASSGVI